VPSSGQKAFGDALLASHKFIFIPGAVSTHSWNLIFDPGNAAGAYAPVAFGRSPERRQRCRLNRPCLQFSKPDRLQRPR
jgi:RES domain-containing protein